MRRPLALAAAVVTLAGCGDEDEPEALVVSAASSLQTAFTVYGEQFGEVRYSFAGSDELAAQIRQGVTPDVFASANTSLPEELSGEGLVGEPTVFAGNRLVLAVPAGADTVPTFGDVAQPGVKLAVGSASVPIGGYTRDVLAELPAGEGDEILANVRSEEPDVRGIVGKLTQGAVDAGFVYITDVTATKGALEAIGLPDSVDASAAYAVAVVEGAENPEAAQRFIDGLLDGEGQAHLEAAGFEPPPAPE